VREGTCPDSCCILLKGFACRHKTTSSGERQIVSFHIPGDILDVQHLELARADHNVQAISAATVAWIPKRDLQRLLDKNPVIRRAIWRSALVDASIFREWVLNVGRRDAISRVAHMLCEFAARYEAAGLGAPDRFELPMTQEQIADATGLTAIHVNRMLQELRARGVIMRERRDVRIIDWDGLRRVADFDPAYLHLAA
jgi:CRP-like cAMP-binding protein